MNRYRLFPLLVITLLAATNLFAQQGREGTQQQKQDSPGKPVAQLKIIKSPIVSYPDEAQKKNIEGKVTLRIEVDAQGKVSDAKPLSGPSELVQAAIESVKQWEFEPPNHAPVVTTAEVWYGHPKECPGPVSDSGEVIGPGGLKNKNVTLVEMDDAIDGWPPPYFAEDRKAGIAGELVLSITVDAGGKVTKVRLVKSLSPHLDNAAVDTVRTWRFKLTAGDPDSLPDDFPVQFFFRPLCSMKF
jgi:TonB family protein